MKLISRTGQGGGDGTRTGGRTGFGASVYATVCAEGLEAASGEPEAIWPSAPVSYCCEELSLPLTHFSTFCTVSWSLGLRRSHLLAGMSSVLRVLAARAASWP